MNARRRDGSDTPPSRPPSAGMLVLSLLAPLRYREEIAGTMEEEYNEVIKQFGSRKAKLWFWLEIMRAIIPFFFLGLRHYRVFSRAKRYSKSKLVRDSLRDC